jgi:hypothetical protein
LLNHNELFRVRRDVELAGDSRDLKKTSHSQLNGIAEGEGRLRLHVDGVELVAGVPVEDDLPAAG